MSNILKCDRLSDNDNVYFLGFENIKEHCYYRLEKGKVILSGKKSDFFDQTELILTGNGKEPVMAADPVLATHIKKTPLKSIRFHHMKITGSYIEMTEPEQTLTKDEEDTSVFDAL